jgi:hypothetical protein
MEEATVAIVTLAARGIQSVDNYEIVNFALQDKHFTFIPFSKSSDL